jgi:hypothetical protein
MENNNKKIKIIELYSHKGVHKNFLTALIVNLQSIISQVIVDRDSVYWSNLMKQDKKLLRAPKNSLLRELYYIYIAIIEICFTKDFVMISGAGPLTNLFLALFVRSKNRIVIFHSEFERAKKINRLDGILCWLAIKINRLRRVKILVLSNATCKNIIKENLYSKDIIFVLTHPLLAQKYFANYQKFTSIAALGLFRKQKLNFKCEDINILRDLFGLRIVGLGVIGDSAILKINKFFDNLTIFKERYSEAKELTFLRKNKVGTLLFMPNSKYKNTVSGVICDATRLGCYVFGPSNFNQGFELIGNLYISNPYNLNIKMPDINKIKELVIKRRELNNLEMSRIIEKLNCYA